MSTEDRIWQEVEQIVLAEGFELFDMDLPGTGASTLRVYVVRPGESGIGLDEVAAVSRSLDRSTALEEMLPEHCVLEVSSPGINRRLRLPRHFTGALGQRVKLTVTGGASGKSVVRGVLNSFDGKQLSVDDEESHQQLNVDLSEIKKARIDYLF